MPILPGRFRAKDVWALAVEEAHQKARQIGAPVYVQQPYDEGAILIGTVPFAAEVALVVMPDGEMALEWIDRTPALRRCPIDCRHQEERRSLR